MERILRGLAIRVTRAGADRSNRSCFGASLAEAAIATGSRKIVCVNKLEREMGVNENRTTPTDQIFAQLRKGADALNLEVVDIVVSPNFLTRCDNPTDYSFPVRTAIGKADITIPNIRVMANEYEPDNYALHGELADGSQRSIRRIEKLKSEGWFDAAAIAVRKRSV